MDVPDMSYRKKHMEALKRVIDLERQLEEAREEVDYAINFFNKNEQFGVVGILKGIENKLKEQG